VPDPQNAEAISRERAGEVFADLAAQGHIAFRHLWDGCYARAHLLVLRLLELGLSPRKVWTFTQSANDLLWVNPPGQPAVVVHWGYHVAPTVVVQEASGQAVELVLDPALFSGPVTVEEWRDIQHDSPRVLHTALGEPPLPARGGSGYWPGPDPVEGPDVHAREKMEEYLALQS
jgi:hypothetical protein